MKNIYFLIIVFIATAACKTKTVPAETTKIETGIKPFVLKFDRGPCFGKCPVYTFYLLSDNRGILHHQANLLDTAGWYITNPDQEAVVEILELLEPQDWWMQDLSNFPEISDLPSTTLTYHHPGGMRTISIQSRTTESLENVFEKFTHLVNDSKWEPTLIRPLEIQPRLQTDVIVHLKEGVDINTWMTKFERYGIYLKKRLSPNQSFYLVARDVEKGNANDFLQYIKRDPDVIEAQWDTQVQRRD